MAGGLLAYVMIEYQKRTRKMHFLQKMSAVV